MKNRIL